MNYITAKELVIKMDSLLVDVNRILAQYTKDVNQDVNDALKAGAKEAVKALKYTSPAKSGDYAKGWAVKQQKGNYVVYNKKKPGLTHLLENGHDVVVNGQKYGHVNAKPHIKEVEEWTSDYIEKQLKEKLNNEH